MGTKVFQLLQQSSDVSGDAMFIYFLNLLSTGSEYIFQDELSSKTESWLCCIKAGSYLVLEGECEVR